MKLGLGFIFLSTVLLAHGALAAGAYEHDWWQSTFGAEIPTENFLSQVDLLVIPKGAESCRDQTQKLLGDLGEYAEKASRGKSGSAGGIGERIVKQVRGSIGTPCEKAVLSVYLLGSFFVAQTDFIHTSVDWEDRGPSWCTYDLYANDQALNLRNVLLAALLLNEDRVRFLTDAFRSSLGGEWASGRAYGGYDCQTDTIYIDPSMRPFDLGATFEHEMDHLLRDKLFGADLIRKYFSSDGSQVDWAAYLTVDESLAAVLAAVQERDQALSGSMVWNVKPFFGKSRYEHDHLYKADQDFTFRAHKGPLEEIFQSGVQDDPLMNLIHYIHHTDQSDPSPGLFSGVFRMVHAGYFGGSEIDPASWSYLDRYQPNEIIPFRTVSSGPGYSYAELGEYEAMQARYKIEVASALWGTYLFVSDIKRRLGVPSDGCQLYQQDVLSGKVEGYYGLSFGARPAKGALGATAKLPQIASEPQFQSPTQPQSQVQIKGPSQRQPQVAPQPQLQKDKADCPTCGEQGVRPGIWIRPCLDLEREI